MEFYERDELYCVGVVVRYEGDLGLAEHGRADGELDVHVDVQRYRRQRCPKRSRERRGGRADRHAVGKSGGCCGQRFDDADVVEYECDELYGVGRVVGFACNQRFAERRAHYRRLDVHADLFGLGWKCSRDDDRFAAAGGLVVDRTDEEHRWFELDEPRGLQDLLRHQLEELHAVGQRVRRFDDDVYLAVVTGDVLHRSDGGRLDRCGERQDERGQQDRQLMRAGHDSPDVGES